MHKRNACFLWETEPLQRTSFSHHWISDLYLSTTATWENRHPSWAQDEPKWDRQWQSRKQVTGRSHTLKHRLHTAAKTCCVWITIRAMRHKPRESFIFHASQFIDASKVLSTTFILVVLGKQVKRSKVDTTSRSTYFFSGSHDHWFLAMTSVSGKFRFLNWQILRFQLETSIMSYFLIRIGLFGIANSSTSDDSLFLSNSCWPFFFRPNLPFTRASSSRRFFIFLDGLKSTFTLPWGSSLSAFTILQPNWQQGRHQDKIKEKILHKFDKFSISGSASVVRKSLRWNRRKSSTTSTGWFLHTSFIPCDNSAEHK